MLMVPSLWDLLDLVCKFLTYLGAASLVGTLFCLWLFKNESSQFETNGSLPILPTNSMSCIIIESTSTRKRP